MDQQKNVAILVHKDVEVLDFCGPFEVFGVAGSKEAGRYFNVFTVAEDSAPVRANTGMLILPNYSIDDCPPLFMLLIPGGSTNVLLESPRIMEWVKKQEGEVDYLVSVCTGAFVLAKLGFLDGLESTTHYSGYDSLQESTPTTTVRRDVRLVDNGRIVTGAGVAAGIDLALHMIAKLMGMEQAKGIATYMMYNWTPEEQAAAAAHVQQA